MRPAIRMPAAPHVRQVLACAPLRPRRSFRLLGQVPATHASLQNVCGGPQTALILQAMLRSTPAVPYRWLDAVMAAAMHDKDTEKCGHELKTQLIGMLELSILLYTPPLPHHPNPPPSPPFTHPRLLTPMLLYLCAPATRCFFRSRRASSILRARWRTRSTLCFWAPPLSGSPSPPSPSPTPSRFERTPHRC